MRALWLRIGVASLLAVVAGCGGGTAVGSATTDGGGTSGGDGSTTSTTSGGDDGGTTPSDASRGDSSGGDATSKPTTTGGGDAAAGETSPSTCALPPAGDFTTPGPYATKTLTSTLGANKIVATYPTDGASCPHAAFVFAHGFQLQPDGYQTLLAHIASWGYVIVSSDYPGTLLSTDHRDVRKALLDAKAALIAGSITGLPAVDGKRIIASGHSLGGKGATMAAIADATLAGAFAFDPVDGNPSPLGGTPSDSQPQLAPTQTATIAIPIAYVGATQSHCAAPGFVSQPCAPTGKDAKALYDGTTAAPARYWLPLCDFGHMQFLDNPNCPLTCTACVAGKADVPTRVNASAGLAVAFARTYAQGDVAAKDWLSGAKHDSLVSSSVLWNGTSAEPACP